MTFPSVPTDPGVVRQVLTDDPALMLVSFRFQTGAVGKLHQHPHVQASFCKSGRFSFQIGAQTHEIGPGDTLAIPSNTPHGCHCLHEGELIDSFAPRRDDFL